MTAQLAAVRMTTAEADLAWRGCSALALQVSAPIRPDEVRGLLLHDFHESDRNERGHLVVRSSKTEAGTDRVIPLDREAEDGIRAYLRFERPPHAGEQPADFNDREPIFLTQTGTGVTYNGWTKRNQLLRRS
ncbi:MAG TPA: hypothetical protein VGS17_02235 [Candidatus Limnocylindria bacterium]|nr:hypothetical protein [Candidatus Limnocylindria bacterium]